jgi:NAD(P)H dehydrogenase (quinone)
MPANNRSVSVPAPTAPLLVTGASGHLGRRVLELLIEQGAGPIIATTRDPARLQAFALPGVELRQADFDDAQSLSQAFAGAARALLISTDAIDRPGRRLTQHKRAVDALAAAGVQHVVYTSLPNPVGSLVTIAGDHAGTEAALAESALDYTILRNNLYTDYLLYDLPAALASGELVDARGEGAVSYVTREDCARTAAAALADRNTRGRRMLDVSGPEALTGAQIAALISELAGRPIRHVSVPQDALVRGMVQHGLPQPLAEIYASFHASSARGDLSAVTDTVARLTGQPPQSVRDFLRDHRAALAAA